MKILIIEDNSELQEEMTAMVTQIGHSPIPVSSGEEALQLIGVVSFDVVILDIEMPSLDGLETTILMREALGSLWVPIIFATTEKSDATVLAGVKAGGDDYLFKPFSPALLKAKLIAMQRIAKMQHQLSEYVTELALLSETDGLTQLLNRRAFTEKAVQTLLTSKRQRRPNALIMLDVDHFKLYNDSYGHAQGDVCLQQISQCLKNVVKRDSDLVARYGGEEFIILLPETDIFAAEVIAQKIIDDIAEQKISHQASPVADLVTVSLGIELSDNQETLEGLTIAADKNLYQAKANGRNQYVANHGTSNKTILIADDNIGNLTLLTDILKNLGNIITVDNQTECLELAEDIKPDLLLLDIDGDEICGIESKKIIEKTNQKSNNKERVINCLHITTNQNHPEQHINIAKPIDIENLRTTVDRILRQ
ncbi:MAG: diguanylate cyclase (GGDEF)-like protein [Pseudohongiellaceae bacterium]|jgi:diguanylate cyclase (GGDEF)-like protein